MADILIEFRQNKIEPKTLRFLHRTRQTAADLFLIEGTLGGGKEVRVLPPLVLYDENGTLSPEVKQIYRS